MHVDTKGDKSNVFLLIGREVMGFFGHIIISEWPLSTIQSFLCHGPPVSSNKWHMDIYREKNKRKTLLSKKGLVQSDHMVYSHSTSSRSLCIISKNSFVSTE